jgi:type I restriction enzyme M protein
MYAVVGEHVFPRLRTLGGNGTTYSKHMEGARFTIPTPALLAKVVDMIDKVPMEDRDTKGDLYEYMLGKIASAGQNGQFRTPRHIIRLMVEMVEPKPTDIVCDSACGTCGFLVAVGESLRKRHPEVLTNAKLRQHFHRDLFHGFDFDNTMLRIDSMNMLLARCGESGHHLSRFARAGPCRGGREVHAGAGQSAVCRVARLRELCERFTAGGQDQEEARFSRRFNGART